MANLTESPIYESGIFQLEKSTPAVGGAPVIDGGIPSAGHANAQAQQLANRTAYLNLRQTETELIVADVGVRLSTAEIDIDDLQDQITSGGSATTLASDLINNTDSAKGSSLVGFDGESVSSLLKNAKTIANYANLRTYTGVAEVVRIKNKGVTGLFYYDAADTTSPDNGGTVIVSSDGKRWKRYLNGAVYPEWFGAVADDTTDCSIAFDAAFATGLPIMVVGKYVVRKRFVLTGPVSLIGITRQKSSIRWPSDAPSAGISVTAATLEDQVTYNDVDLINQCLNSGSDSFLFATWAGLTGYSVTSYFTNKFVMIRSLARCDGDGRARKMCEVRNLYGGLLEHAYFVGNPKIGTDSATTAYRTTHGFHASHDGVAGNTVGMKLYDVHCYNVRDACTIDEVEGVEIQHCDFQVCWNGMIITNFSARKNQYRITDNHVGVNNTALKVTNTRHLLASGNEFSWGSNRAVGTFNYIELFGCEDPHIVNNTIRGNGAVAAGHTIRGLSLDADATSGTLRAIVDANTFRDLSLSCNQSATSTALQFGTSNNFVNGGERLVNAGTTGTSSVPFRYGPAAHINPVGVTPLALFTNVGASALALNRDAAGSVQTFHIAGATAAGIISCTSTATTYGTTSDATLKIDAGEISLEAATRVVELIKFHKWEWKLDGSVDEGVFAQELHKIYPKAVFVGGERTYHDSESGEDIVHYEPWSVDYSKLIVPLGRCMQGVLEKQKELDSRLLTIEEAIAKE